MFHLPTSECTITLQDVALQLILKFDGVLVITPTLFDQMKCVITTLA